jgi:hypothetical protein
MKANNNEVSFMARLKDKKSASIYEELNK